MGAPRGGVPIRPSVRCSAPRGSWRWINASNTCMEEQGPFDRILQAEPPPQRDRAATVIVSVTVALGLLLLVLVLPPVSILDDGGVDGVRDAADAEYSAVASSELPPPPAGFEAVSPLYSLSSPESAPESSRLTLSLSTTVAEAAELALFTYEDDEWKRVGDAIAVAGGTNAQGELSELPANVAVFLPRVEARVVLGSLPAGAEVDPVALGVVTTLNPRGFVPAPDGSIGGGGLKLPQGLQAPVAPTISALSTPDVGALNTILPSTSLRTTHVQAILALVRENSFVGIDLDYRAIDPVLKDDFVALIQELSDGLRAENRRLTLTLPLPLQQDGDWNTLGYDWEALAPLVDAIKLAPEPDQDRYYQRMEEVLAYLVPRVSSRKLVLTIGPLSRESSVDGVSTLTLTQALALAGTPALQGSSPVAPEATVQAVGENLAGETGASGLAWDDTARAVVFSYAGLGGTRTVWIANVFSEAFRLDLARRYQLGGVVVEDVSKRTSDANIWPAVRQYGETGAITLVKPNGQMLQPRWTASGGTLESNAAPLVTWRAPAEEGSYTLTLIVSDGVVLMGQRLEVAVESTAGVVSP